MKAQSTTIIPFQGDQWLPMLVGAILSLEREKWIVDDSLDAIIIGRKELHDGKYAAGVYWLREADVNAECDRENAKYMGLAVLIEERGAESTRHELESSWASRIQRIFSAQEPPPKFGLCGHPLPE